MGNYFAIALGVVVVLFHGFLQSFVVVNLPIHLPFPQQHNNRQSIPQQKGSYDIHIVTSVVRDDQIIYANENNVGATCIVGERRRRGGKNSLTATTMLLLPL